MEIKINKTIPREVLENIFVTALEGGSNYWYTIEKNAIQKVREVVPDKSIPFSLALFQAVYDHNAEIEIHDLEDSEELLGTISLSTMQQRIQKAIDEQGIGWALENEMDENGDATSSDVIFQVIVMGEVTFG